MLANLVIVFFFISGNEPNTSDYTELVKTTSSESTNNIIYNLFNNKNEGCFEWRGERKRRKGNKFHNVIKLLREGR